jgi:xylan 1,4-beta-xylosidase
LPEPTVPPFHGNINFNAQHSPAGAFFSFTCGHFGTRGGFGLQIGKPGNQDLYIGVKDGDRTSDSQLTCLPFYEGAKEDAAAAFLVEQERTTEPRMQRKVVSYRADQIKRHYGWASDKWVTPDFEFTIHTPFFPIPEPKDGYALQLSILPAILADLVVDNTKGTTPKTVFFAMGFPDAGARLDRSDHDIYSFGWRRQFGVRGVAITDDGFAKVEPFTFMRWTPDFGLKELVTHGLGNCPGIGITVPPGQRGGLRFAIAAHLDGVVTTGIEGKYFYTRAYGSLDVVMDVALTRAGHLLSQSALLDRQLLESGLSADQQFLIAHSTRSYYGSTQLLDVGGDPFWIVNEGEYCMMNTLDLSVDHVFWELKQNPWVVRNLLDNFVRHYSYIDDVIDRKTGKRKPGGISFCHDMGIHNNFSPRGNSSYELPNLDAACFSYMTAEQLCNWILMAASYAAATGDDEWVRRSQATIHSCMVSLMQRCGENGWVAFESSRCGKNAAEITTYDSLDHSLAQTRNNVYMAVKCWAAYRGLALLLHKAQIGGFFGELRRRADLIVNSLTREVGPDGILPAVFEPENTGHRSRILPAIEGLIYPLMWGDAIIPDDDFVDEKALSPNDLLRAHTAALLKDPEHRNQFADGGLRLSSTSNNSWISKIAIFQHVARAVFGLERDATIAELFARADAAHVKWETEGASAYWAMSDQMVNGVAQGSKYYPRCVTTALWLNHLKS